jgi:hypothetical protein
MRDFAREKGLDYEKMKTKEEKRKKFKMFKMVADTALLY